MATSTSKYVRLWLWNGASWTEVTAFTNMVLKNPLNAVPMLNVNVYATTSAIQSLLVANTPFRVTDKSSTNGFVSTFHNGVASGEGGSGKEILTGTIQVIQDTKTVLRNNMSVVWAVTGYGLLEKMSKFVYDASNVLTGTTTQVISTGANSILTTATASGNMTFTATSTETPTISILARQDNVLDLLIDIASIGDAVTLFTAYVDSVPVDATTGDFRPSLRFESADSAIYVTSNPFTGPDETRIVDEKTETRTFNVYDERDRIFNAVKVVYAGSGSSTTGSLQTSEATDATSIANFGKRNLMAYAPWIQDSATAILYRDTVLNMFKGVGTSGIQRMEATLKTGQLFGTTFNAKLGDQVGFRDRAGNQFQGKLLSYTYNQVDESLSVVAGLPRNPFFEDYVGFARRVRQQFNSLRTSASNSAVLGDFGTDNLLSDHTVTLNAGNSPTFGNSFNSAYTFSVPNTYGNTDDYYTLVSVQPTNHFDGPLQIVVQLIPSTTTTDPATGTTINKCFGPMISGNTYIDESSKPFTLATTTTSNTPSSQIGTIRLHVTNLSADANDGTGGKFLGDITFTVWRKSNHVHVF